MFSLMHSHFKEPKNLPLPGSLSSESFLKLSIYSYEYSPYCVTILIKSLLNSCDKYVKSISDKFLTNESRLEFINYIRSIKTKLLLIVKAMYFLIHLV